MSLSYKPVSHNRTQILQNITVCSGLFHYIQINQHTGRESHSKASVEARDSHNVIDAACCH